MEFKSKVLSVQPCDFKDKNTGEVRKMWRVYLCDSSGGVGSIYSSREVKLGQDVTVAVVVSRDGAFKLRIV